jgi:hypothetical protein
MLIIMNITHDQLQRKSYSVISMLIKYLNNTSSISLGEISIKKSLHEQFFLEHSTTQTLTTVKYPN